MAAEEKEQEKLLREKIASLPKEPGVYQFRNDKGRVIYVGKAKNLRSRVRSYFSNPLQQSGKTQVLVTHIRDLEIIITSSEVEALILENNLIKELKPRYNINLKDDKTYPWLVITAEPFPRIFITRNRTRDRSIWFGPYTEAGQLRTILDLISSIFPVRSCRHPLTPENIASKKYKLCLDYHIHKCKGPCEGLQEEGDYLEMIGEIVRLLKGKTAGLRRDLHEKMLTAAEDLRFEEAAEIKLQLDSLKRYSERQKIVAADGQIGTRLLWPSVKTKPAVWCSGLERGKCLVHSTSFSPIPRERAKRQSLAGYLKPTTSKPQTLCPTKSCCRNCRKRRPPKR